MQCHISNLMIINLYLKSFSQNCFQCFRNFKFTVEKNLDILCQRIADLLISADSCDCKRNMVSKWKKNPSVYGISKHFLWFCQNCICNLQILRLYSLYQFLRRSTLCLLFQTICSASLRLIKTLADLFSKANTFDFQIPPAKRSSFSIHVRKKTVR